MLWDILKHLAGMGHQCRITAGANAHEGEVALLHVDASLVSEDYLALASNFEATINFAAKDITKKRISTLRLSLEEHDDWTGPVMIKTDLNFSGIPEKRAAECFRRDRKPADLPPGPIVSTTRPYPVLGSANEVPDDVWDNPGFVVERFLPEQDEHGYWVRAWVFFGDRERCTRYRGTHPIVKSETIVAREPAPVPDELRAERARLGFDYGKFDFVVRDGRAILFDANRTPSAPPPSPEIDASNAHLAGGLEFLLRQ